MINFDKLYTENRESFNLYLKQFHKEYPKLDLFTCEMILRTPKDRIDEIMAMYESGELKDPSPEESGKTFVINSATIHHPDDEEPPKPITIELIEE